MKKKVKTLLIGIFSLLAVLLVAGWFILSGSSPVNRSSAIKATLTWAKLEPLPSGATDLHVKSEGSLFTRTFTVSFTAGEEEIENWLTASPGTREVNPVVQGNGSYVYAIVPGGGATFAKVLLSSNKTQVTIQASWS